MRRVYMCQYLLDCVWGLLFFYAICFKYQAVEKERLFNGFQGQLPVHERNEYLSETAAMVMGL